MGKSMDLVIRNGVVVFPDRVEKADIGVSDGKIVEISQEISQDGKEVIDAAGKHIFPAATDGHVHFDDPGRTEWETIKNGSQALAAGGGGVFFDMPLNSSPCTLDRVNFEKKLAIAKEIPSVISVCGEGYVPQTWTRWRNLRNAELWVLKHFPASAELMNSQESMTIPLTRVWRN